eukprot:GHVL01035335.1.p1 GENE.GHVL01035335.1~~GHVL01035335.1.p1  ORF type:complete len:128 (+),score=28.78 GHVL01035335.1:1-384(+)
MTPIGGTMTPIGGTMTPIGGTMTPIGGTMTPIGGTMTPITMTPVGNMQKGEDVNTEQIRQQLKHHERVSADAVKAAGLVDVNELKKRKAEASQSATPGGVSSVAETETDASVVSSVKPKKRKKEFKF